MHPFSHIVWSSLWLGLASDALNRARAVVRAEARKNPGSTPISATRLAEADIVLFEMRNNVQATLAEYQARLNETEPETHANFGFAIRVNNLKIASSQLVIDVVGRAMLICGIAGYRNDSKASLGRHLRDAYGASLMVNNDRILGQSATMQIGQREG
jgi:acyl-CoA dehydrogenase